MYMHLENELCKPPHCTFLMEASGQQQWFIVSRLTGTSEVHKAAWKSLHKRAFCKLQTDQPTVWPRATDSHTGHYSHCC